MDGGDNEQGSFSLAEAFAALGNETRLEILNALWELRGVEDIFPGQPVPFSTLRKHVGMSDGSQFNYHLKQLVGRFVRQTEGGYQLRRAGAYVINAMLAGTLTDKVTLDGISIDTPCPLCGASVVLNVGTDRTIDWLTPCCTACEGSFKAPGVPSGALELVDLLSPAGTRGRTPTETYHAQSIWTKHQVLMMVERVCPTCSGKVSVTSRICEDHAVSEGYLCAHCDTIWEIMFTHTCNVCETTWYIPSDRHLLIDPTVVAFYHDHGYSLWGLDWVRIELETIEEQTILSEDPLQILVTITIDSDQLEVILGSEGEIIEIRS